MYAFSHIISLKKSSNCQIKNKLKNIFNNLYIFRPGGDTREIYCSGYSKDIQETQKSQNIVHMIAERDTDSMTRTPTPQHPHQGQHHHLSLHELRVLQV